MVRTLKFFFLFLLLITYAQSQQHVGEWKSFTDMKSVRSAILIGTNIWAATGGGVFVFDTVSGLFTKYTNVDGLDTNDVLAIGFDNAHTIWIGGSGGWVNVYDLNTHRWQTIADIAKMSESTHKGIRSFSFKGDTVFIVTEFGVSVFKRSRWEFGDTYQNLGFIAPQVSCMALQQNQIWIGTDNGLATSTLGSGVWTTYNSFPGITSLALFNDTLIIGTTNGMVCYAGGTFSTLGSFSNKKVCDLRINNGKLLVLDTSGATFSVEAMGSVFAVPQMLASNTIVRGTCIIPVPSLWVGTADSGLAQSTFSNWKYFYPNGPNSNFFNSLVVDQNGVLWCGSGERGEAGFYKYNPALTDVVQWKNFNSKQYPLMRRKGGFFDAYYKVSLGAPGSVWVSSWGNGVIEVVDDSIKRIYNYYTKPSLPGARTDINNYDYVVSGGVAIDNEGKVWIDNRNESNGRSLIRLDNDTSGTFFDNQLSPPWGYMHGLMIDRNDTKWIYTTVAWKMEEQFLNIFNENKNIEGAEETGWMKLSKDDGLLSNIVLSLAIDLDGVVWAGTGLGVVYFPDPLNPKSHFASFPLQEQVIQSIAVDALNNKWVGTKEGIFVVNSDGTQLLQSYTVTSTNKQLLSNDVRSITIDQTRGIAYFGTEQGLSSLAIAPVQTSRSYSELECGPNPYLLPNNQPLTIRNLIANSTIKILSVSGSVVKQFDAQGGGRAFWDGRDKNGAYVGSGIYFIVALADNGSKTITGKVAVIRKN